MLLHRSLSFCLSVCLSVCSSVCLSVCPTVCLSVRLSIRLFSVPSPFWTIHTDELPAPCVTEQPMLDLICTLPGNKMQMHSDVNITHLSVHINPLDAKKDRTTQ